MKLYVLRHADAEGVRTTDIARELTPLGHEQARTVAAYLAREGIQPGIILASPYVRTMQTAEIVGAATGAPVQKVSFLASGMAPDRAMAELRVYASFGDILIVGHQPDLGDLSGALVGGRGVGAHHGGQSVVDLPGVPAAGGGRGDERLRAVGAADVNLGASAIGYAYCIDEDDLYRGNGSGKAANSRRRGTIRRAAASPRKRQVCRL